MVADAAEKSARKQPLKRPCDQLSPVGAVVLRLRARYVSKAAILTIPAPLMPVSCRSKIEVPLEFQGLESLGAALGRRFFSCEFDS